MIVWLIIAGILGGVIGGMGMGGGTLTIPILTIFFDFKQKLAQGINLIAFLPMSVVALIIHSKNKLVKYKQSWGLALVGCIFSLGASFLAVKLENGILKKIFAVFLILIAIWQTIEFFIDLKKKKQKNKGLQQNQ